jgi:hypothetical protein
VALSRRKPRLWGMRLNFRRAQSADKPSRNTTRRFSGIRYPPMVCAMGLGSHGVDDGCMELGIDYLTWGRGVDGSCSMDAIVCCRGRACGDEGTTMLHSRCEAKRNTISKLLAEFSRLTVALGVLPYHYVPLQLMLLSSAFTPPNFANVKHTQKNVHASEDMGLGTVRCGP